MFPVVLQRFLLGALLWPLCVSATIWPHPKSINTGNGRRYLNGRPSQLKLITDDGVTLPDDVVKAFHRALRNIERFPLVDWYGGQELKDGDAALEEIHIRLDSSKAGGSRTSKRHGGFLHHVKRTSQVALGQKTEQKEEETATQRDDQPNGGIAAEIIQPVKHLKEAYTLKVPQEGPAEITASSSLGILRALTSFEQLVYSHGRESGMYAIRSTPIEIHDEATYPYRGLLIDTARNYYTVAQLKHQIDAMSFVKMNQLHWHIVDSQSFPLKLDGDLGVLAEKGAYGRDKIYDAQAIREITSYAAERGVGVNVEIDMPGHTYEGVVQYDQDLIACPNKHPWQLFCNEPPCGQLKLDNPNTNEYVQKLLGAILKLLPSHYFSTGNDEVNLKCYGAKNETDIDGSLLKPFVKNAHDEIRDAGKTPMVWEEAAIQFPETGKILSPGTLVQAWTTPDNVGKILASNPGVLLLHSPTPFFYLDCGRGEWLTNTTGPSYCDYVTFGKMYSFDPTNGTDSQNVKRVIGGEAALWGEQSDGLTADNLIWPRTGAAAEIFWTGKFKTTNGRKSPLDLIEATKRLNELRYRFVARGVRATPVQPEWCVKNPASCLLDIVPGDDDASA